MSPDTEDPEAVGTAGEKAVQNEGKEGVVGGIERASTRTWAEEIQYDPVRLFNKVSIEYTSCLTEARMLHPLIIIINSRKEAEFKDL